jgi:hypothetical protein
MIQVAAAMAAVVLFLLPLRLALLPSIAIPGALALLLATTGIVLRWRWPVTAAGCIFVVDYAAALWAAAAPVSVVGATGFGLALLFLLQSADLARAARNALVDTRVVRSQLIGWVLFGATALASAVVVIVLARGMAGAIPFAMAPLLAAASALGVILALASALTRASGRGRR